MTLTARFRHLNLPDRFVSFFTIKDVICMMREKFKIAFDLCIFYSPIFLCKDRKEIIKTSQSFFFINLYCLIEDVEQEFILK